MDESDLRMDQRVRRSMQDVVREAFVTGLAVVVPLVITVVVLAVAVRYVYNYLDLFSDVVLRVSQQVYIPFVGTFTRETLIEVATPVFLLWLILVVGLVTNVTRWGEVAVDYFDYFISQIPAVGGVYESFRQMSDVVLESDTQNFREVKLVEFPHEGAYTLGFVTTETPVQLSEAAGHSKMLTLFLPLAPNPVMGGHLVHMPASKVMDVDMTVEEGIRAVVTSGVAVGGGGEGTAGLSAAQLKELARIEHADQQLDPAMDSHDLRRTEDVDPDRPDEYDDAVDPTRATTPDDIARRERTDEGDAGGSRAGRPHGVDADDTRVTPAQEAGRYPSESDPTDEPPAAAAGRDPDARERTADRPAEAAGRTSEDDAGGQASDGGSGGRTSENGSGQVSAEGDSDQEPAASGDATDGDAAPDEARDGPAADDGGDG